MATGYAEWSPFTTYAVDDVVQYAGQIYVATVINLNVVPQPPNPTWTNISPVNPSILAGYVKNPMDTPLMCYNPSQLINHSIEDAGFVSTSDLRTDNISLLPGSLQTAIKVEDSIEMRTAQEIRAEQLLQLRTTGANGYKFHNIQAGSHPDVLGYNPTTGEVVYQPSGGGGGGTITGVGAGTAITVDNTNPNVPVVNNDGVLTVNSEKGALTVAAGTGIGVATVGTTITISNTSPSSGGTLTGVGAGTNISVDNTVPAVPVVSLNVSSDLDLNTFSIIDAKDITASETVSALNYTTTTPLSYVDSGSYVGAASSDNFYQGVLVQNKSATANASANVVAVNDSAGTNYAAMGINSSAFANVYNTLFEIPDASYFSGTKDTVVGAQSALAGTSALYLTYGLGANAFCIDSTGALSMNASRPAGVLNKGSFGSAGQYLTSAGASAPPTWTTPSAGTLTGVGAGAGITVDNTVPAVPVVANDGVLTVNSEKGALTIAAGTDIGITTVGSTITINNTATNFRPTFEYFVAKNGNDLTGDGSMEAPFATIQKAVDIAEAAVGAAVVYVSTGTYSENVLIERGDIAIQGASESSEGVNGTIVVGLISVSINTGTSDLFGNQVILKGLFISGGISDTTASVQHTLILEDCRIDTEGLDSFAISVSGTVADQRTFLTNCRITQTATAATTNALVLCNTGRLLVDMCNFTVRTTSSCVSVGGTAFIAQLSLSTLESAYTGNIPQPIVSISSSSTEPHNIALNSLVLPSATAKLQSSGIAFVRATAGVSVGVLLNNFFNIAGTSSSTDVITKNVGTTLFLQISGNKSATGTSAGIASGTTVSIATGVGEPAPAGASAWSTFPATQDVDMATFDLNNVGVVNLVAGGSISTTGTIDGGAITGTSLSAGAGTISGGAITGTSLSAGSGTIGGGAITGTSLSVGSGTIGGGAITGTSVDAGSGTIQTTGAVNGGAITGTSLSAGSGTIGGGAITGTSLSAGSGTISGGAITGTSLSAGSGTITGGAITGTSVNAGSGTIATTGAVNGGAITGTSLSAGAGTIGGGAITGTSLSAGAGTISGGAITGTSVSAGSGTISGGAITGTSVSAGSGTIATTGAVNGGAITGTSLSAGAGTISGGAITGTSVSVGSGVGTITGGIISGVSRFTIGAADAVQISSVNSRVVENYSPSSPLFALGGAAGAWVAGSGSFTSGVAKLIGTETITLTTNNFPIPSNSGASEFYVGVQGNVSYRLSSKVELATTVLMTRTRAGVPTGPFPLYGAIYNVEGTTSGFIQQCVNGISYNESVPLQSLLFQIGDVLTLQVYATYVGFTPPSISVAPPGISGVISPVNF